MTTYFSQKCPTCARIHRVNIEYIGKEVRCANCRTRFVARNCDQTRNQLRRGLGRPQPTAAGRNRVAVNAPSQTSTVLIVEGNRGTRETLARHLTCRGHAVLAVWDTQEALLAASLHPFSVALIGQTVSGYGDVGTAKMLAAYLPPPHILHLADIKEMVPLGTGKTDRSLIAIKSVIAAVEQRIEQPQQDLANCSARAS